MKLYTFVGEYKHPEAGFGTAPVWHGTKDDVTYASMTDECLASFNAAQDAQWTLGTDADVGIAQAISPRVAAIKASIPKTIRAKYTIDDELQANRLRDPMVLDDIAAMVAVKMSEIDELFGA